MYKTYTYLILIVNGQVVRVRIKNKINVQYENLEYKKKKMRKKLISTKILRNNKRV